MGTTSEKLTYLSGTKDRLKTTINYAGAGLTDETFRQYPEKLYNKYLDILKDNGEELFNALPKVTGTGTSITLNNTAKCPMAMSLGANMEQASTTGKNKLNLTSLSGTNNNVTYSVNRNGELVLNGACNSDRVTINLPTQQALNGTFTFSTNYPKPTALKNGGGTNLFLTTSSSGIKTETIDDTITQLVIYGLTSVTFNNQVIQLQIEEGSTATDYEPYTGGIPAPNPSYPETVHTVSGNNTITIANNDNTESQTLPLNLGNIELCKIGDYEDEFVIPSGSNLLSSSFYQASTNTVACEINAFPSGTYTLSYKAGTTPNETQVKIRQNNQWVQLIKAQSVKQITFTLDAVQDIRFETWRSGNPLSNYFDFMLNEGTTALPYEPYNPDGKWYLKKNIGKVVLDGSENWMLSSSGTPNYILYCTQSVGINGYTGYCTHYPTKFINGTNTSQGICDVGNYIRVRYGEEPTINDYKAWLSANNVSLYLPLSVPKYILLNDTLQSQLTEIYNKALSYDTQTNISQVNNDLPFVISASAVKEYDLNDELE